VVEETKVKMKKGKEGTWREGIKETTKISWIFNGKWQN
jgi:hypothetical protein